MSDQDSAQDSGTEAAGPAVEPDAQPVDEAQAGASSEDATVAEQPQGEASAPEPQPKRPKKRLPRALRRRRTKPVRERPARRRPISRTPKPETEPGSRQERRGVVVSDSGDKTIVVQVDVTKIHPRYRKVVRRTRKFHAHDEQNAAGVGDTVRIVESRPLSKTKHWRLAEILEKAK